jgi:hypothetical protein
LKSALVPARSAASPIACEIPKISEALQTTMKLTPQKPAERLGGHVDTRVVTRIK